MPTSLFNKNFLLAWSSHFPAVSISSRSMPRRRACVFGQAQATRDANIFTINFLQRLNTHGSCAWSKRHKRGGGALSVGDEKIEVSGERNTRQGETFTQTHCFHALHIT